MFLLEEPLPATRQGLWFDVRTDEPSSQRGALIFVSVGALCETLATLAETDLASLSASGEWRTRCVTVEPAEPVHDLGVYVDGDRFSFAFDALRAGPPCDTD
jgi:hypothetical protein